MALAVESEGQSIKTMGGVGEAEVERKNTSGEASTAWNADGDCFCGIL